MSERISLANLSHLAFVVALMAHAGDICPKCGYGTRKTSKRWARCKQCGERVERKPLPTESIRSEEASQQGGSRGKP